MASKLDKNFEEDLEFAKKTEKALKRIEQGKGVKLDFDTFIDELKGNQLKDLFGTLRFKKQTKQLIKEARKEMSI